MHSRSGEFAAKPVRPGATPGAAPVRGSLRRSPAPHPELRAESLRKAFGERIVLDGITLQINAGDIVAIVGTSGSGKAVFLDCLTGLMDPTSGRILVADHGAPPAAGGGAPLVDLAALPIEDLDRIRLHWALVFQKNALFSGTVYDNIALWLREHTSMPEDGIRELAERSLKAVSLDVADVLDKEREALSGGMAKRVAIARAIAVDPLVIFYDEPTTGLDPIVSGQIHELIWNNHHRPHPGGGPRTTVIVTHDKDLLRRLAPRIVMLDGGRIAFDGSYSDFNLAPAPAAQQYLQAMPVLHARWDH